MDDPCADVMWHDVLRLGLRGQGWSKESRARPYDRFPAAMQQGVSEELWRLSTWPAGEYVDFRSAACELFVRWTLEDAAGQSPYMAASGRSGLDGYGRDHAGRWRWIGCKEISNEMHGTGQINATPLDGGERLYRVYVPLMRRVLRLEVGARERIEVLDPDPRRPIAYYGTSIVHGQGVSRPGMAHAAQLGRALDREILNLGFCGRAWCERVVAEALGRLDPCLYIIDVLPNNSPEEISERLPSFLRILRTARPHVPVLLLGDRVFGDAAFMPQRDAAYRAKNRALDLVAEALCQEGMGILRLAFHEDWYGADGEGTSDASHPNDLGAWRMAQALEPIVRRIVG